MSDIDDFLNQSTYAARIANAGAQDDDPDQAARALELSDATGDPATAIYGDVEGYEKAHKTALGSQIISDNQFVADWLNSHPMAPRVAHDDLGALDDTSRSVQALPQESGLKSWLKSDSIARSLENAFTGMMTSPKAFQEGFGDQPIGSSVLSRPNDLEWATSHPGMAAVAAAVATPPEVLARATGGLLGVGHEQVAKYLGESWANELQGMAEWAMMRGDMPPHMDPLRQSISSEAKVQGLPDFDKVFKQMAQVSQAIDLAEPWTKIDKEPPVGLHPLIDDAKKTQARDDISTLDDALSTASKSATRERAPDLFANFIRDHVGDREIGIDPEAVRNLYGDDAIPTPDDGKLGFVQDLKKQLEAAEVTGDDVRVPLADWLAKVDPEVAKQLHDDIRVRDNGMTINETKIGQDVEPAKPEDWKTAELQDLPEDVADLVANKNVKSTPSGKLIHVDPETGERLKFSTGGVFKPSGEADVNMGTSKGIKSVSDAKDYLGYGKKTAVTDPVAMLRGSGGMEPLAAAGDRKIELRRLAAKAGSQFGPDQGFHDLDIHDENGKRIGTINLSEQNGGKELYIDMIQAGSKESKFYEPNYLGTANTRNMLRQLREMFPNAETLSGHRVSGAREAAGTINAPHATWKLPMIKLQIAEGMGDVQGFRDLLQPYWDHLNPTSDIELLRGPMSEEGKKINADVMAELKRIAPQANAEVVHSIFFPKVGGSAAGLWSPRMRKIFVSLESKDPVGTARHEVIHFLRSMGLIREDEWLDLKQAAKEGKWRERFNIDKNYANFTEDQKDEEAIAEAYRAWRRGEDITKDPTVFQRIKDFIDMVHRRIKEALGRDFTWEEIFKEIDEGRIGRREQPFESVFPEEAAHIEEPEGDEPAFGIYDRGKALGVTQSHMDRMLSLIQKRNAEDLEAANRRAEVRQRRRSNKDYKDRRTTLRDDVSNSLQQRPDIALDRLFAKQKIKFNPAYLSEDQRARLPKEYLQKKDGINPDDLAPYFGYTSGDALVERLGMLTEDRRRSGMSQRDHFNRLVDVETDRRLNQEFGDREQNILDEAKDQALSETQLNLVHEETMAYAYKAHGPDYVPQFNKDQVRDMVRSVFNDTPVGSIKSDRMIQTAGKIGKKIEEAGSKGDWSTAYRLSQQRNHAMIAAKFAREYERQRTQLDRVAKQFRKREVASVPAEYTNWVHDLLQRTGYPINRSIQDLADNISRQTEDNLRDFKNEKEKQWMGVRELPIADYLMDPGFRMAVDKLSYTDFMGLKNSIDTLVKAGRDEKKVYLEGEAWDRKQTTDELIDKLASFGYSLSKAAPSLIQQAIRLPVYGLLNKETTFNRWDRDDPRGLFNRLFSYPLAKAANGKAALEREMAKTYKDIPKPQDLDKLVEAPFPDPLTRTTDNPEGDGPWAGFTRGNVLQMLHNVGNKSNRNVLARGLGISPEEAMQFLFKNTTKEDWDRAQQLGDNMWTKLIAKADNVYERMTGATIEKIELDPIDTPFGQYKGWYYPLDADPVRKTVWVQDPDTGTWSQQAQGKRDTIDNANYFHFTTANGYTKKRTGAIYPLNLDFNMTPTRINQMIHDINFKEVIHETQKILLDPRFKEAVAKYYGKEYADGLAPYLRRLAGSASIDSVNQSKAAQFSNYLRGNVISTYIGFNPYTMMKHGPTALIMSMREVGAQNFLEANRDLYIRAPEIRKDANDTIKQYAEEVMRRERHWQDSVGAQGREIIGEGNDRAKAMQMGAAGVAWSDMVSAKPTWWAAFNKSRADGLSIGESVDLSERAVRRAHGSTAETNMPPAVAGSGDVLHPWLTSVYGFFGTAMQRRIETAYKLNDAYHLLSDREFKAASQKAWSAFGDFMTYMVWPTIVEEAVTGIGTDDHRSWGMRAISGLTMGAASSVLYLRDLVHGMLSGHEPGIGMASSAAHDLGDIFRDFAKGRDALNRQHAGKTISDLLTLTGEATGKMPKIVGNTVRYGINTVTGQEKPKTPADILLGVTKGTQKRRQEK